jgi:hypothetical protein
MCGLQQMCGFAARASLQSVGGFAVQASRPEGVFHVQIHFVCDVNRGSLKTPRNCTKYFKALGEPLGWGYE